jgi:uncharacterized protein (TIGR03067 family)
LQRHPNGSWIDNENLSLGTNLMKHLILSAALLAATAIVTPPAASADDKPLKGDLAKLQGQWKALVGPEKKVPLLLTVEGSAVKIHLTTPDGDQVDLKGEFKIDDAAKPHKTIDWVKFTGPNGNEMPDRPGIYTFEDKDTLKVCTGHATDRPTEFVEGEGGEAKPITITFKRESSTEKPKDKQETAPCDEPKAENPAAPKGDLAKLQGTWTGKIGPGPEKNIPLTMTVKDKKVSFTFTTPDGEERELKGEFLLDESAKPHKSIDWVKFARPDGEAAPTNFGIYAFEGNDTLKVCNGGPGNERPTEFKAGEGGPPNLFVLTRKPEAAK